MARALLADGTIMQMRELGVVDAPLVAEMYRTLPAYDRYLGGVTFARQPPGDP